MPFMNISRSSIFEVIRNFPSGALSFNWVVALTSWPPSFFSLAFRYFQLVARLGVVGFAVYGGNDIEHGEPPLGSGIVPNCPHFAVIIESDRGFHCFNSLSVELGIGNGNLSTLAIFCSSPRLPSSMYHFRFASATRSRVVCHQPRTRRRKLSRRDGSGKSSLLARLITPTAR